MAAIESQMYLPFFLLHLVLHSPSLPFAHLAVQIVYFLPFDVQFERIDPAGGLQPKIFFKPKVRGSKLTMNVFFLYRSQNDY